MLEERMW